MRIGPFGGGAPLASAQQGCSAPDPHTVLRGTPLLRSETPLVVRRGSVLLLGTLVGVGYILRHIKREAEDACLGVGTDLLR